MSYLVIALLTLALAYAIKTIRKLKAHNTELAYELGQAKKLNEMVTARADLTERQLQTLKAKDSYDRFNKRT